MPTPSTDRLLGRVDDGRESGRMGWSKRGLASGGGLTRPERRRLSVQDELRLRASAEAGICPACGAPLGENAVGTGARRDGLYCSLECLARTLYLDPRHDGGGQP